MSTEKTYYFDWITISQLLLFSIKLSIDFPSPGNHQVAYTLPNFSNAKDM